MEILGLIWIPNFIVWILVIVIALYVYGTHTHGSLAALGYPGPKPKAFIGNMDIIFGSGHYGAWDSVGKKLHGKVFSLYEGIAPTIVVFNPDMIKDIMVKEFQNFVDRRDLFLRGKIMRHSMIDIQGDKWRRIRNMTTPFFTTGKLKKNMRYLEFSLANMQRKCLEFAESKEPFEVKVIAGSFAMESICLTALGLEIDSQNDPDNALVSAARGMTSISPKYWGLWVGFAFPFTLPFLEWLGCEMWPENTVDTFAKLTREIVRERKLKQNERPDFIQMLIRAHEMELELDAEGAGADDPKRYKALTEDEIIAQVALFMMAGYDTTATTLSFMIFNLANNPQCQERLLQEIHDVIGDGEMTYENIKEMTYLNMCMDESIRLYPGTFRSERKCLKDITLNGYFIPKGTLIHIPTFALQRDPDFWTDPEKFDPERFSAENRKNINPYVYQPFGTGPRNCVGLRLAQLEIKMAVTRIVQNFKLTVNEKTQLPIKLESALLPRATGGLWVNVEKR